MILFDITVDEIILSTGKPDGHSATLEQTFREVNVCPAVLDISSQWLVSKSVLKNTCDIFIPKSKILSAQSPKWFLTQR